MRLIYVLCTCIRNILISVPTQASVISIYCTYLIWSGLAADPSKCNIMNEGEHNNIAPTLVGIALTFFVVLWSVLQTSSSNYSQKLGVTGEEGALLGCTGTSEDGGNDQVEVSSL